MKNNDTSALSLDQVYPQLLLIAQECGLRLSYVREFSLAYRIFCARYLH